MSEARLDFDRPLWSVEIYHRNPGSDGVWFRTVNADSEKAAIKTAVALFVGNGLNELLIDQIITTPLSFPEGGESDAN